MAVRRNCWRSRIVSEATGPQIQSSLGEKILLLIEEETASVNKGSIEVNHGRNKLHLSFNKFSSERMIESRGSSINFLSFQSMYTVRKDKLH